MTSVFAIGESNFWLYSYIKARLPCAMLFLKLLCCSKKKKFYFLRNFSFFKSTVFWLDSERNLLSGISANVDYNRFTKDRNRFAMFTDLLQLFTVACMLLPFSDKLTNSIFLRHQSHFKIATDCELPQAWSLSSKRAFQR